MLVHVQLIPFVAASTQSRHDGLPEAVTFVHGEDHALQC